MEAARFWACPLDHWDQLSVIRKAKMQAHFLHVRMREGYSMEHASGDKAKKSDAASLDDLMSGMSNNPCIEVIGRPAKGK